VDQYRVYVSLNVTSTAGGSQPSLVVHQERVVVVEGFNGLAGVLQAMSEALGGLATTPED
jgi:hypothetical protein